MSGSGEEEDTDSLSLRHILHTQSISQVSDIISIKKYIYLYIKKPLRKLNTTSGFLMQRMGVWYFKHLPSISGPPNLGIATQAADMPE